jgi:hypothetical protein
MIARISEIFESIQGEEMWICNKKARKCYIFIAITDQDKKFFDVLLSKKKEV